MDKLKTVAVAALTALVVAMVWGTFKAPVTKVIEKQFGALAGPDIPSPYLNWGGLRTWNARQELKTSTTTVCSIQAPASTSTLDHFAVRFTVGSTTAKTIYMAKGASMQASTTLLLAAGTLAANAQGTFVASTSPSTSDDVDGTNVIPPNWWVNVSMAGGIGVDSPTGSCQAQFMELY